MISQKTFLKRPKWSLITESLREYTQTKDIFLIGLTNNIKKSRDAKFYVFLTLIQKKYF